MNNPTKSAARIDALALLQDMIRCRSVTPEADGVLDVVAAMLEPLGFEVSRLRFEGGGSYPVDNLFATRRRGGKHLLFAGHTDVVPPGPLDKWHHAPFAATIEDDVLYGRGAVDMKSGIAAFCEALADWIAGPEGENGTISLLITNDEEADAVNGTKKVLDWAAAEGHAFDFCLVGEPSSTRQVGDGIKVGRRGSLSGEIVVTGTQGHVAYPDKANNPVPVASALAAELSGTPLDAGSAGFQPSNLELTGIDTGNQATNVIPAQVGLKFNIRFNTNWDAASLDKWIAERIAAIPHYGCRISYRRSAPVSQCFKSPPSPAIENLANAIRHETGLWPEQSTGGGTSDARFVAQYCPAVECGLVGETMHQIDERLPIAQLPVLVGIYRRFLGDYLAGDA